MDENTLKEIGIRLKIFRNTLMKDSLDFCEELGVSSTMYSRYENGRAVMKVDLITKLKEKYDCNPLWMIVGDGSMKYSDHKKCFEDLEIQYSIIKAINKLLKEQEMELKELKGGKR